MANDKKQQKDTSFLENAAKVGALGFMGAVATAEEGCKKTETVYINTHDTDTVIIREPGDTVKIPYRIDQNGDSVVYDPHTHDSTVYAQPTVSSGKFAKYMGDPLADNSIVGKIERLDSFVVVEPGYYDVPSNPPGRVRTTKPANGIANFNLSHISSGNGYQSPLHTAITAIGGFVSPSLLPPEYAGYNIPDYSRADVCNLMVNSLNAGGMDFKGLFVTSLNNITNLSNKTQNRAYIDGALSVLKTVTTVMKNNGRKTIIDDCLDVGNYVNVPMEVGKLTPDIAMTVRSHPISAQDESYYVTGLRHAINGANANVHVYTTTDAVANSPTDIRNIAAALKRIGRAATQGTRTAKFDGFVATKDANGNYYYLKTSDLDANAALTGYVHTATDKQAPSAGDVFYAGDTKDVKWHNSATRSFDQSAPETPNPKDIGDIRHCDRVAIRSEKELGA